MSAARPPADPPSDTRADPQANTHADPQANTRADPRDALFDTSGLAEGLGRRAGKASLVVLVVSALKVAQQIVSVVILARLIPPAEYGIFALAVPAVMLAMALSNFGLPQAILQRARITHAEVSALFWLNTAFALAIAAAMAALAGPAAAWFDTPQVAPVFVAVSVSLVFSAMSNQYLSILRRTLRIRAAEHLTLLAELAGLCVAIAAALAGLSYWALVLQQIVTPLLKTVLMGLATGWRPSGPVGLDYRASRAALGFGGFVAGAAILTQLTEYVGTVIAGSFFDPTASGLFYRARNLAGIPPKRVLLPLSGVFVPTMARLQDDAGALRAMFIRLTSRANLILLPIAVLMAAGAEPLVALLLGPDWAAAAPLMALMSVLTFREAAGSGLQYVMIACGQSRPLFFYSLLRLGLVAAAMILGAPHGLLAMTAACMAAELFVTLPLMVRAAARATPVDTGAFLRACGLDMVLAAALAGLLLAFVSPRIVAWPAALQLAALCALIGAAVGLRIALSADLRRDAGRALAGFAGRLGPRT